MLEGPPLGPGGKDITWPNQVAPRGQKASSTPKIKPQTSNPHHKCTRMPQSSHMNQPVITRMPGHEDSAPCCTCATARLGF